jgi:DsbC/DsbD-like thiol-disulfide interchange protein
MALRAWMHLVLCVVCCAPAGQAQPSRPNPSSHARVELLSRQGSITPGRDLQLGIHFALDPGWHIYWINPGDSGQPPVFKWQLPEGFSLGEIQWPHPERMQPNKQLADYGYHDEVLLPVTLHVPAGFRNDSPAEIGVDARWLICREVCIPEHAQLQLALPLARTKQDPVSARLFTATDLLLPRPMPRNWNARATSTKDEFLLVIKAGKPVTKAIFFPLDPGEIDNPAPQKLQPSMTGLRITLKKSDILLKPVSVLRGVLVVPGGPAYRIDAPVRQSIQ